MNDTTNKGEEKKDEDSWLPKPACVLERRKGSRVGIIVKLNLLVFKFIWRPNFSYVTASCLCYKAKACKNHRKNSDEVEEVYRR